jgi:hypothetical protein
MQRKQQVGECWVCVIFFARVVDYVLHRVCGGVARPPLGGCKGKNLPRAEVQGQRPREKKNPWEMCHIFASIFMSVVGRFFGT